MKRPARAPSGSSGPAAAAAQPEDEEELPDFSEEVEQNVEDVNVEEVEEEEDDDEIVPRAGRRKRRMARIRGSASGATPAGIWMSVGPRSAPLAYATDDPDLSSVIDELQMRQVARRTKIPRQQRGEPTGARGSAAAPRPPIRTPPDSSPGSAGAVGQAVCLAIASVVPPRLISGNNASVEPGPRLPSTS